MGMKTCKECGTEISKSARVCPKCGKKQKVSGCLVALIAIIILIIIIAISGGNNSENKKQENTKTEYNIGEEAILNDGAITVTNVEKSKGNEWDKPQTGKEYVIVSVTIENKGKENLSYNPFDFEMQNSQGQRESTVISIINNDTELKSGELIAGGKVSGTIIFEQPEGDNGLMLIYKNNVWSSKEVKIKLQ